MNKLLPLLVFISLLLYCCTGAKKSASIDNLSIVPRSGWNANEPRPYKQHTPIRITIHHEGTRLEVTDDAAKKIRNIQVWGMGPDRNWTDIPYHFLISPGGTIYEGRNPLTVGETATEYDPTGHLLINCLGNLEQQELRPEQLDALIKTVAYAAKKFNISPDSIASHKDYSKMTNCPGKNLYPYVQNGYIKNKVKELLKKNS